MGFVPLILCGQVNDPYIRTYFLTDLLEEAPLSAEPRHASMQASPRFQKPNVTKSAVRAPLAEEFSAIVLASIR
jgi:hypothetical protein